MGIGRPAIAQARESFCEKVQHRDDDSIRAFKTWLF